MANHANAKKAHRQNIKRAARNKSRMSKIRTLIKKVLQNISAGVKKDAETSLSIAQSELMRGVKKNIIKKNTASRKVSRLANKVKTMDESKADSKKAPASKPAAKKEEAKAPAKKTAAKKAIAAKKSDKKED